MKEADNPFDKFNQIAHGLIEQNPTISFELWKRMLIDNHHSLLVEICGPTDHEINMVLQSYWDGRRFNLGMSFSDWQKYYESLLSKYKSYHKECGNGMKIDSIAIIRLFIAIAFLIIAYLFALNGRYSHTDSALYLDKWTKQALIFNPDTGRFEEIK